MKKKMGWYLVLLLLLGVMLLTISCGGTKAPTAPPAPPASPPTQEQPPPPPPPPPPKEEEPPPPAATPMAIPHTLEGHADCLMCHTSGEHAVPAEHAGRTNDTCTTCHEPPVEEPAATPTAIPHTLEGHADCLMCHESGGLAVPADHAGHTSDTCTTCHQPAS